MNKTILVVDDDKLMRQGLVAALVEAGFTVVEAVNGQEGLQKATEGIVDAIVTDVQMPEMNGLEMAEELRKNDKTKSVPIIVLTVDDRTSTINQALFANVTTFLSKSTTDPQTIVDQILSVL